MGNRTFFISPTTDSNYRNNYLFYFFDVLSKRNKVVNMGKPKLSRSLDMFRYGFTSDVMILHWPEDVVSLGFGALQALFSIITVVLFKLRGGEVVWFCHNKQPHSKKNKRLNNVMRKFYSRFSNLIVVHSTDALNYVPASKSVYLPHPSYEEQETGNKIIIKEYDVLIWGNIFKYKGLDEFIDSYKQYNQQLNVLIIGKADKDYYNLLLEKALGTNIVIEDKYLDDDALQHYFNSARIILLPYLNSDTFCSGALIHSLNSNKIVIGPALGNFMDVYNNGACLIYKDHNELFQLAQSLIKNPLLYYEQLDALQKGMKLYRETNTWNNFMTNFLAILDGKQQSFNTKAYITIKKMFTRKQKTAEREMF